MYLFLATGLYEGVAEPENDEYIEVIKFEINELLNMIHNGEITDSKTIIGVTMANNFLKK